MTSEADKLRDARAAAMVARLRVMAAKAAVEITAPCWVEARFLPPPDRRPVDQQVN